MNLGTRSIRSSGRGSGSIEITLPSALRGLNGLACRVSWQGGATPQIRLVPDLAQPRAATARLWSAVLVALGEARREAPPLDLPLAAESQPGACWEDALALSAPGPMEAAALSRLLAPLLAAARPQAPANFGAMLAFLTTGSVPTPEHREDCLIAAATTPVRAAAPLEAFADSTWHQLRSQAPWVTRLCEALAADPAAHRQLQAAARSGGRIDLQALLP